MPAGLPLSCPPAGIGHPQSFLLFPLKMDSRLKPAGMTREGGLSLCHARRLLSGIQRRFSFPNEDGFPLTTCGNDKGCLAGMTRGPASPSVMPDGGYRASSVVSLFPEDGFPIKDVGNDKGGLSGMTRGAASPSVMPDGGYRASRVFSLFPMKMDSRLRPADWHGHGFADGLAFGISARANVRASQRVFN